MHRYITFYSFIVTLFGFIYCTIPDYIHVCHHDDPQLAECIMKSIEALRPLLKTGIPELQVPPLEPLPLDSFMVNTLNGQSNIAANISKVLVHGASDFQLLKLTPTLTKNGYTFRYEVNVPQVFVEGEYNLDSKILFINLQGHGPFTANITDYHFECIMKGHKIQKNGVNHLEFEKMKCRLVIGPARIHLGNLFGGNELLGKATNDVLNDNSEMFFQEIKPVLESAVNNKFTEVANKITLSFSYAELFP